MKEIIEILSFQKTDANQGTLFLKSSTLITQLTNYLIESSQKIRNSTLVL